MRRVLFAAALATLSLSMARDASAQSLATNDPVLRRMWTLGMDSSQTYPLAQALLDSVGPRLTGTPGQRAANQWIISKYRQWGITAREEQYGTWMGWRRGITHVDLIQPRVRSLEAMMLAWSVGTPRGAPVEAQVVVLPNVRTTAEFDAWLPQVRGKFVMVSFAQPTCRPTENWREFAPDSATVNEMLRDRAAAAEGWARRVQVATGESNAAAANRRLPFKLAEAGARGLFTHNWSNGWGVDKIFNARPGQTIPSIDLSCEDYGLVFRLAENNQSPVVRVAADAQHLGEVPVFNVIGEIKGSEKPNEYVMLSAHFDSWDGGSGATDNGTGTITMLEAMRILKLAYPNPKRTILVGHWSGEEQGLIGSRAYAADHPEVVQGLQALFNQDNGTGRVVNVSAAGLVDATSTLASWLARVPREINRHINFGFVGGPSGGGSDNASFICYGAPAFSLGSISWDYGTYTWHTNRDTFDKIVFPELKNNATLTAMLAYLASEDPESTPRTRGNVFGFRGGAGEWPECQVPPRKSADWQR